MSIIIAANEYGNERALNGCKACEFELSRAFSESEREALKLIQKNSSGSWSIEFYSLRDNENRADHHFLDCHPLLRPMIAGWLESLS